ncbi:MAG: ABC transporter ATP-binding protein/permease [Lachnospiraceae bacterium]|nr:ABC transporter ATP-binding protein/permease [Lachnospiraceae bacterium]
MHNVQTITKCIREYKKPSMLAPISVALECLLECFIPLIMARLINQMDGSSMRPIIENGALLIVMAFGSLACGILAGKYAATASTGLAKNMRDDLFERINDFSFADVDKFSSSSLVTRMTTDVTNVSNAYQMLIRMAFRAPLMLLFSIIMSASINLKMATYFMGMVPILAIVLFGIVHIVHPIFKRIFKKYDALNNSVQENIAGIRVVKAFVREDHENKKFSAAAEEVRKDFTNAEKILAFNTPVMTFCIYLAILLVCYNGAKMIINSGATELTAGELSSLLTYGVQCLVSLMMASMVFVMTTMSAESAARIAEVLNTESTLKSPDNGIKKVESGDIDFENVSFKYKAESKKYALSNINLHIKSGETVGILGGTGSSKSSLIQLIPRLYDVSQGSVKVGGKDVREYDLVSLRDAVAVVLQKNVLFSGTIKENMRWGNKEATDEEILDACKISQADEFIQQFPNKYDTHIERGGTNVSGGQKQRLCIARAILKNPKVLIFDDSTSAVDTKTDALIRMGLANSLPNTTKIIIAQRVSSVQEADKILVMENGEIVEMGNHEELLKKNGIYKELFDSQTKGKEE